MRKSNQIEIKEKKRKKKKVCSGNLAVASCASSSPLGVKSGRRRKISLLTQLFSSVTISFFFFYFFFFFSSSSFCSLFSKRKGFPSILFSSLSLSLSLCFFFVFFFLPLSDLYVLAFGEHYRPSLTMLEHERVGYYSVLIPASQKYVESDKLNERRACFVVLFQG